MVHETSTTLAASDTVTLSKTGGSALTFSGAAPTIRVGSATTDITNNAGTAPYIRFSNNNGIALYNNAGSMSIDMGYGGGTTMIVGNNAGAVRLGGGDGISTSATADIPAIPTMSGNPSGNVDNGSIVVDTTNHRLYVRSAGAWKYAALT